jgi:hypothetical protein
MDYDAWDDYLKMKGLSTYVASPRMFNRHLSTSPYPWTTDSTSFINNELTETSVPAPKMNYPNLSGDYLLNKPVTNIQMTEDGLISFDFMGGDKTGIEQVKPQNKNLQSQTYDILGRRISSVYGKGIFIQRYADGTIKKHYKKM